MHATVRAGSGCIDRLPGVQSRRRAAGGQAGCAGSWPFNLPSSCYATMLVRELTKTSTARGVHKALTQVMLK